MLSAPITKAGTAPAAKVPHVTRPAHGTLPFLLTAFFTAAPAESSRETPMTVFVYVDTSKQVGDKDHLKIFANQDAAETWLEQNDPEGIAFEYEVLE